MLTLRRRASSEPPPPVVSGAMCGLAYTFVPFVPFELLLWGWMVPLLLHLRHEHRFWPFVRQAALTMLVALTVACWWIALPSLRVGVVGIGLGVLFMTVPWVGFYAVRRLWGWRTALWSFPLVWMAWEWAMLASPFGPAGNTLSGAQGRLTWLVQMADVTGAWGVTGWVVLVNVALLRAVEQWQEAGRTGALPGLAGRLCAVLALLLAPPLVYAAARLATLAPDAGTLRVAAVQPSVAPATLRTRGDYEAAQLAALALAAPAAAARPDLLVLPEGTFFNDLRRDPADRLDLARLVAVSGTPVLTGMTARPWVPPAERSAMLRASGRAHLSQNAAFLLTPAEARRRWTPADTLVRPDADPRLYVKRRMIPLVETVPYADRWPGLARFALVLSPRGYFDAREGEGSPLPFHDRAGRPWRAGVLICYEQFYPEDAARAVALGAHLLVAPTNESWFARTSGSRLISVAARLRAVETRRALVRATNTGLTGFVDATGRPHGEVPAWTPTTATATVALRVDQTFYVRHPSLLPRASLLVLALLTAAGLARRARRVQNRRVGAAVGAG